MPFTWGGGGAAAKRTPSLSRNLSVIERQGSRRLKAAIETRQMHACHFNIKDACQSKDRSKVKKNAPFHILGPKSSEWAAKSSNSPKVLECVLERYCMSMQFVVRDNVRSFSVRHWRTVPT